MRIGASANPSRPCAPPPTASTGCRLDGGLPTKMSVGTRRKEGSHEQRPQRQDGELAARISNTVVKALARTTGRGPTKAKTTLGDNGIFVVLQDSLTRGEQILADAGEGEAVLDLRRRWQRVMRSRPQPGDRRADRTQGDRLHERQPHRPRPRGRGLRARTAAPGTALGGSKWTSNGCRDRTPAPHALSRRERENPSVAGGRFFAARPRSNGCRRSSQL